MTVASSLKQPSKGASRALLQHPESAPEQGLVGREDRKACFCFEFGETAERRKVGRQQHDCVAGSDIQCPDERRKAVVIDSRNLSHRDDIQRRVRRARRSLDLRRRAAPGRELPWDRECREQIGGRQGRPTRPAVRSRRTGQGCRCFRECAQPHPRSSPPP